MTYLQVEQALKQTVVRLVSPSSVATRLVNSSVVLVQGVTFSNDSWAFHPSTVNLYSISPLGTSTDF